VRTGALTLFLDDPPFPLWLSLRSLALLDNNPIEFMDDEDEIIAAVAEAIPKLVDLCGGSPYSHLFLEPLELILNGDDNSVREKASVALEAVAAKLPAGGADKYLVPLVIKLSDSNWFTSRSAAASVIPIVYPMVPAIQADFRRSVHIRVAQLFAVGLVFIESLSFALLDWLLTFFLFPRRFANFIKDASPAVRRSAAHHLAVRKGLVSKPSIFCHLCW
jgi:hypothetical protein